MWQKILDEIDDYTPYLEQYHNARVSTEPADEQAIVDAVEWLYRNSLLRKPKVIFCDSPWQLANLISFAGELYGGGIENTDELKLEFVKKQSPWLAKIIGDDCLTRCVDRLSEKVENLKNTDVFRSLVNSYQSGNFDSPAKLCQLSNLSFPIEFYRSKSRKRKDLEEQKISDAARWRLHNLTDEYSPGNFWTIRTMLESVMEVVLLKNSKTVFQRAVENCPWGHIPVVEVFSLEKGIEFGNNTDDFIKNIYSIIINSNMCFFGSGFTLVSNRPTTLKLNGEVNLHSADSPALEYADSFRLYVMDGTIMNYNVIENPEQISIEDIESEFNVEARRNMIDLYGLDKYVKECGAAVSDNLYRKAFPDDETLTVFEFKGEDGKSQFIRVSPDTKNAKEALDWYETIGEYIPLKAPESHTFKIEAPKKLEDVFDGFETTVEDPDFDKHSEELTQAVNVYKKVSLFEGTDTSKVLKKHRERLVDNWENWGFGPGSLDEQIWSICSLSENYIWSGDPECDVMEMNKKYEDFISELSMACKKEFNPEYCIETWESEFGPITVEIKLNGKIHKFNPSYCDDWLDLSIIDWVESLIDSDRNFEFEGLGNSISILFITKDQKKKLIEELKFPFNTPD